MKHRLTVYEATVDVILEWSAIYARIFVTACYRSLLSG